MKRDDLPLRRAYDSNPALTIGLTAVAARRRCCMVLYVQRRRGRARFTAQAESDPPPVGFSYFGDYLSGRGWTLSTRFVSRAELKRAREDLRERMDNVAAVADRVRGRVEDLEAHRQRLAGELDDLRGVR